MGIVCVTSEFMCTQESENFPSFQPLPLSSQAVVAESWVAMETESPTCVVTMSLLSMTTQLFPPSFTFGTLLIILHILHNTWIKGASVLNILPELNPPSLLQWWVALRVVTVLSNFWAIPPYAHRHLLSASPTLAEIDMKEYFLNEL